MTTYKKPDKIFTCGTFFPIEYVHPDEIDSAGSLHWRGKIRIRDWDSVGQIFKTVIHEFWENELRERGMYAYLKEMNNDTTENLVNVITSSTINLIQHNPKLTSDLMEYFTSEGVGEWKETNETRNKPKLTSGLMEYLTSEGVGE